MKGKTLAFGAKVSIPLPEGISKSQRNRIEGGYQKIHDHITEKDIEGAIKDIQGDPILKKDGVPWQHYKEVDEAIEGLRKEKNSLIKSIQNPNLEPEIRNRIEEVINDFEIQINRWDTIKGGNHGKNT